MKRKMKLEREVAERDYARRVAAERAVWEERLKRTKREDQARKAE